MPTKQKEICIVNIILPRCLQINDVICLEAEESKMFVERQAQHEPICLKAGRPDRLKKLTGRWGLCSYS